MYEKAEHNGNHNDTLAAVRRELELPESLTNDLKGLKTVYAAWCNSMTFDNMRKFISLRAGDKPLAGADANDYFEHWLEHRSGGTCWPSSNALFTLIDSYGFDARRVAGAMFDLPDVNHGSVKVRSDGTDWLADSSMLTCEPLPLNGKLSMRTNVAVRTEVELRDQGYLIWADFPPLPEFIACGLRDDPVDLTFYHERYERSRDFSPFNERLYLRKVTADGLVVILGHTMFRRVGDDLDVREFTADELLTALHEIGGVTEKFIMRWADAGGLDASMNPAGKGPEMPDLGPRPSRRAG